MSQNITVPDIGDFNDYCSIQKVTASKLVRKRPLKTPHDKFSWTE